MTPVRIRPAGRPARCAFATSALAAFLALGCAAAAPAVAAGQAAAGGTAVGGGTAGWGLRRIADRPDGGAAFEIVSPAGQPVARIECTYNQWIDTEELSTRIMASRELLAGIIARQGRLSVEDLGPAKYDCVPVQQAAITKTAT